jgi:hypothetical protein
MQEVIAIERETFINQDGHAKLRRSFIVEAQNGDR